MLVEIVLNLFVGDVNTQLLKGITTEVLKTKNVQDADGVTIFTEKNKNIL